MKRALTYVLTSGWRSERFYMPLLVGGCFGMPGLWWALAAGTTMNPIEFGVRLWLCVAWLGWIYTGAGACFRAIERMEERHERRR